MTTVLLLYNVSKFVYDQPAHCENEKEGRKVERELYL